jgi:uncharacterized protein Yka (UPF0111/DUF47 family)
MEAHEIAGLVGTILSFVDFGQRAVRRCIRIYRSAQGASAAHVDMEQDTQRLREFVTKFEAVNEAMLAMRAEAAPLVDVATKCAKKCDELLELLEKLKAKEKRSVRAAAKATFRTFWHKEKVQELLKDLESLEGSLDLILSELRRCVFTFRDVWCVGYDLLTSPLLQHRDD